MVPSLRPFKRYNERLETLQKFDLVEENAIIALGDPIYGSNGPWTALPGTKTEVDDITCQFPHGSVVTLLRDNATAEKLLHWVENPSHTSSRQVIVHIGAHGKVDQNDERNSCLVLAASGRESTPGGKLRTSDEYEDHDEVIGGRSRMEYGDLIYLVDEENDELIRTINEEMVKMSSDVVDQTIGVVKGKENTNDKDKSKGKCKVDEGMMEKDSGEEMDKGKGKEDEECIHEPAGISIEENVQWAEKRIENLEVQLDFRVFVEHPKLRTELKDSPTKLYGSNVRSILALQDISDSKVPWRTELVVLSACHTSEGKATAEGLVNLARAFIIAGVPCVVAVLDKFISMLMKDFYYNLRLGQDVATSLRSAMSRMIEEGCSVKAWAPL